MNFSNSDIFSSLKLEHNIKLGKKTKTKKKKNCNALNINYEPQNMLNVYLLIKTIYYIT